MSNEHLVPATQLAEKSQMRIPHESAEYRAARTKLLAEEIELRRHIERVAEQRRALPAGGEVRGDYKFRGEDGEIVDFAGLFGEHQTLGIYSAMYGPGMKRPCPMCTSAVGPWDPIANDLAQQMSFLVVARSPIERLKDWKRERGWQHIRMFSDLNDAYAHDYCAVAPDGSDIPALHFFTRRDGTVRHFWGGEMDFNTGDPGQDPRGAPDVSPLWTLLDMTPEGRPPHWYPKLDY